MERFVPADEIASQMGAGVDPAPDALMQALAQIRSAQSQPLLPQDPLGQLATGLGGWLGGYRGTPNPMVEQALQLRQAQMGPLQQNFQNQMGLANMARQRQQMEMQQLQLNETRRARTVQEQAEARRAEHEQNQLAADARKTETERMKLRISLGESYIKSGVPSAMLAGQQIVQNELGKLGYTVAPEVTSALAKGTVSKEQKDQIVAMLGTGVPVDHIAKQFPTVEQGYIKLISDAIAKGDDFALAAFDLPTKTKIRADQIRLQAEEQRLANLRAEGGEAKEGTVTALRKEFIGLSKTFLSAKEAFQRVTVGANNPTAMGDVALIFGYMKMLDPLSVVREGEFATAANAGSVPTRLWNLYNRALSGERLQPEQRTDMLTQSRGIFATNLQNQQALESEYRRIAGERGAPASSVVVDHIGPFRGLTASPMAAKAPPPTPTLKDYQAEADRLKKQFPGLPLQAIKDLMRAAGWK